MQTRAPLVVGRDIEMAELTRSVRAAEAGRGTAIFLVGEPGIGKSRLALETTSEAFGIGMQVLRGRGSTIGPMVPFRPLTEALMSLFRGGNKFDERDLGPYRPVLGQLIPEWSRPDPGHDASIIVLAEAVLRLLALVGLDHGCMLVLEDLQDADAETLGVMEYVVDNLDRLPILVLATIRAGSCAALDLAHAATQRRAGTILNLGRLDRAQVRELVASCLEVKPGQAPEFAIDRLWQDSAGVPFVVEELLQGMIDNGQLVSTADGWQVVGPLPTEVPATVVRGVGHRIDRLGPQARLLLSVGAALGHRFPLSVVRAVTDVDDRTLLSHLHAGIAAQMVLPDEPAPDWYAFRHPLMAEALLAQLTPIDRADLSRRAAAAIERLQPGLPGQWCPLTASLLLAAGDLKRAGQTFAVAGRRALADGAAGSAVALLDRANDLLTGVGEPDLRADVLESLLPALAEIGEFERAFKLSDTLDELGGAGLAAPRRAALHTRLAKVAHLAGRWPDGLAQIKTARALLGPDATDEQAAPLDAVAAFLALDSPSPGRVQIAADLARRAVVAAEKVPLPQVACQAWELLGNLARGRDLEQSNACFDRARLLAEEHRLPIARLYAMVRHAGNESLADGDTAALKRAGQAAMRLGAITLGYAADASIAMQAVLNGDFPGAGKLIEQSLGTVSRLNLVSIVRYLLVSRAVLTAHQAKRSEMEIALAEFDRWDGEVSPEQPLALGLARLFCALLEEDADQVERDLARLAAAEHDNPSTFHLAGRHGLVLLLDVRAGRAGWPQLQEITGTAAGQMRWNRHFGELAHAVLHGRAGRADDAVTAVTRAQEAAAPFPVAYHLGLRLIADDAVRHGWGEPVAWLRSAEEYFHQAAVPAVASACRGLLRQAGAPVQQRRTGSGLVPPELRSCGVTVREYEVFALMHERLGNKAVATRLHISPRTVEKHIASLIMKTRLADRTALAEYSSRLQPGGWSPPAPPGDLISRSGATNRPDPDRSRAGRRPAPGAARG
jgi:DNA-binding CsgD family transcriptional regulator